MRSPYPREGESTVEGVELRTAGAISTYRAASMLSLVAFVVAIVYVFEGGWTIVVSALFATVLCLLWRYSVQSYLLSFKGLEWDQVPRSAVFGP